MKRNILDKNYKVSKKMCGSDIGLDLRSVKMK